MACAPCPVGVLCPENVFVLWSLNGTWFLKFNDVQTISLFHFHSKQWLQVHVYCACPCLSLLANSAHCYLLTSLAARKQKPSSAVVDPEKDLILLYVYI